MAISRTARILIAVLLVGAAGFFWYNYYQQQQQTTAEVERLQAPVAANGAAERNVSPLVSPSASQGTPVNRLTAASPDTAADTDTGRDTDTDPGAANDELGAVPVSPSEPQDDSLSADVITAVPVLINGGSEEQRRDLVVDQLPFLVTEAPATADVAGGEGASSGPLVARRSSVNPFSPIIVSRQDGDDADEFGGADQLVDSGGDSAQRPAVEVVDVPAQPGSQGSPSQGAVQVVTVPAQPSGSAAAPQEPVVEAPAPRPLTPAPTPAAALPRPLPSGTLSPVPEILREARATVPEPPTPTPETSFAEVVVPDEDAVVELPTSVDEAVDVAEAPEPLTPGRASGPMPDGSAPLAVGADALSRYLRDNDVRFTGQVLGPLSVGVFRSTVYDRPAVVTLGQVLPETDIVLSALRGYEARFSLGEKSQVLSLDSRR